MKKLALVSALVLMLITNISFAASSSKVVISENGDIIGITNKALELIQKKTFWQKQLLEIEKEINEINAAIYENIKLNKELRQLAVESNRDEVKFYRDNPDIRPSPAEMKAEALRDKADNIGIVNYVEFLLFI